MTVAAELPIGTELLGYRIERVLGRGGMGVVYLAEDRRLKRRVALKLVVPQLAGDEQFQERLLAESELAASLDHPNVVPIYEVGEADGRIFISMRYVEGEDLKRVLRRGSLTPARTVELLSQVAAALDAAHARGLVHRDVKPSNVLIAPEAGHEGGDHVYLVDFGLSRRVAELMPPGDVRSLGTIEYVAPEQIRGDEIDGRADVYSLGCGLFECLAGRPPFRHRSGLARLYAHLEEEPPGLSSVRPELPKAIDAVVARALAKNPDERYATARQLVAAARLALGLSGARARRRKIAAASLALLAAAGLAAALASALTGTGAAAIAARQNTLVRIDPKTNRITAAVQLGHSPCCAETAGRLVWAFNGYDETVSAVDARTNRVVGVLHTPTAIAPSPVNYGALAVDASGPWVWKNENGQGVVTHYSLYGLPRAIRFPYHPLALELGGGGLWVLTQSVAGRRAVLRIDLRSGAMRSTPLPGVQGTDTGPGGITSFAVGQQAVWAPVGNTIVRLDRASGRVTGVVRLPGRASARASVWQLVVGGGVAWALVFRPGLGNQLVRIDPKTLRATPITSPHAAGAADAYAESIAYGLGALWWSGGTADTLWRFDPRTNRFVATIRIAPPNRNDPGHPLGLAVGAGAVWVTMAYVSGPF
jgi:tRNA A-37 threonylcarbamoyl transferase component Bud32